MIAVETRSTKKVPPWRLAVEGRAAAVLDSVCGDARPNETSLVGLQPASHCLYDVYRTGIATNDFHRSIEATCLSIVILAWATSAAFCTPVTGWLRDTSFGGGSAATLTAANTNAPILGSGASNNADNVAIYAPMPLVSLADAQQIVLTGTAEFIGTSSVGDFRWGLFKDDGVAPATAGWLGYFGSRVQRMVKDPTGTSFTTTTFASIAAGRGFTLGQMSEPNGHLFDPGTYAFEMTVQRFENESLIKVEITNSAGLRNRNPVLFREQCFSTHVRYNRVGFLSGGR